MYLWSVVSCNKDETELYIWRYENNYPEAILPTSFQARMYDSIIINPFTDVVPLVHGCLFVTTSIPVRSVSQYIIYMYMPHSDSYIIKIFATLIGSYYLKLKLKRTGLGGAQNFPLGTRC